MFSENEARGGPGGGFLIFGAADLVLSGNQIEDNSAHGFGGGGSVLYCGTATVEDNAITDNDVQPGFQVAAAAAQSGEPPFGDVEGAGLSLDAALCGNGGGEGQGALPQATVEQRGNLFESNLLASGGGDARGAGEVVRGASLVSRDDVFHANRAEDTGGEAILQGFGGAIDVELFDDQDATAHNLVATANRLPEGEGGAINLGSEGGSTLTLVHATIAGNGFDGVGEGSAIDGGDFDTLALHNSIVHGNDGASEEIAGFEGRIERATQGSDASQRDIRFTLACDGDEQPLPGEGNLCADPALADVADGDVRQTATSPSIDAASGALQAGIEQDFEGDDRAVDGDDDGEAVPDMGADEAPAADEPEPEPEPDTQQPGQPTPPPPPAAGVAGEQARSCVSRRHFRIRLRNRRQKVTSATVLVNGKRVRVLRGKRLTSVVDLRGLPKGRFTVKIVLRLANGKKLEGVRRYRTCTKPRRGGIPRI